MTMTPTPTATIASEIQEIAKTLNDGCHNPGNCWSKACQRNHQCSTSLSALAEKVESLEADARFAGRVRVDLREWAELHGYAPGSDTHAFDYITFLSAKFSRQIAALQQTAEKVAAIEERLASAASYLESFLSDIEGVELPNRLMLDCAWEELCGVADKSLVEKVKRLEAENERLRENAAPRCDQCSCLIDGGSVTLCKTCRAAPPEVVLRDALDVLNDTMQVGSIEYYRIFKLIADASKVSKSIEGFLKMKSEFDPFSATLLAGEGGNIHQQPKGDANGG